MSTRRLPMINWLDTNMAPPSELSMSQWRQATAVVVERMRGVRAQLSDSKTATWDDLLVWIGLRQDAESLGRWGQFIYPHQRNATPAVMAQMERSVANTDRRFLQGAKRMGVAHVLRGWLRRRAEPLTRQQKQLVQIVLDEIQGGGVRSDSDRLETQQFRRLERHVARMNGDNPVMLSPKDARELPALARAAARDQARSLGWGGWAVLPHEDLGKEVLRHVSNRTIREFIWTVRQKLPDSNATVQDMLAARYREAVESDHSSAAHHTMFDRALSSPRAVTRLLNESMTNTRGVVRAMSDLLNTRAPKFGITGQIEPWDVEYLLHRTARGEPERAMPLGTTVRAVVGKLVAFSGFELVRTKVHGTGGERLWSFDLMRADGTPAQIWLAPFCRLGFINRDQAGFALGIRERWHGTQERMPVAGVQLTLMPTDRHISWENLRVLCHELGHALHFMTLPGHGPDEFSAFPNDLVELPSQLLEMVAHDPEFLASVSSASKTQWRAFLADSISTTPAWLRDLSSSHVDMRTHMSTRPHEIDIRAIARQGAQLMDMATHPADMSYLSNFQWYGAYAASDYTYPFTLAMCETLTTRRGDGSVDAQATGLMFADLVENLLSKHVRSKPLLTAWENWRGCGVVPSIQKGVKARARALTAHTRAAAHRKVWA